MTDTTLRRHLTKSALDPNLIFLLEDIASACRAIANLVRNGAFEGNLGSADEINVQGETQKPSIFLRMMNSNGFAPTARALQHLCQKKSKRSHG